MSGGKFCSRMLSSRDDQNMVKGQGPREKRGSINSLSLPAGSSVASCSADDQMQLRRRIWRPYYDRTTLHPGVVGEV